MAKRYGIATPEDLERQERERRRKEAEYQALLMPEPGTAAWDKGLETSTPFFDILTGGIGIGLGGGAARLTREIIARQKGGLLGKTKGGGVLEPRDVSHGFGTQIRKGTRPSADVIQAEFRSPFEFDFKSWGQLAKSDQDRLIAKHNVDPNALIKHMYDNGGRDSLMRTKQILQDAGMTNTPTYKMTAKTLQENDRRFGYNVVDIHQSPDDSPFWWDM